MSVKGAVRLTVGIIAVPKRCQVGALTGHRVPSARRAKPIEIMNTSAPPSRPAPAGPVTFVPGQLFQLGEVTLEIIPAPGHTPGHSCFHYINCRTGTARHSSCRKSDCPAAGGVSGFKLEPRDSDEPYKPGRAGLGPVLWIRREFQDTSGQMSGQAVPAWVA